MSILNYTEEIIIRDLHAMREEISLTDADLLWKSYPGIINSVGTLSCHICGNLRHFIGTALAKDGYIRDRDAEFNQQGLKKEEILQMIDDTISALKSAFEQLTDGELEREMPDTPPQHKGRTVGFFLIQLCCHLSRHRGQLDYLRRIISSK